MSGAKLFGAAWRSIVADKVQKEIDEALGEVQKWETIQPDALSKLKRQRLATIAGISNIDLLAQKRTVGIKFRKSSFRMAVRTPR